MSPHAHLPLVIARLWVHRIFTCFVIQPFDGARYDKRYKDVFTPAIKDAGLEPYRVDHDPSVSVLIDDIERGIENSSICLAEISTDNPNVWYELGYAIASKRAMVLVCSDEERTTPFPFDVKHRKVIKYSAHSTSDFDTVQSKITLQLKAVLNRREKLGRLSSLSSVSRVDGLEHYEIAGLVAVAEGMDEPGAGINTHCFRQNMEQAGFTKLAGTLALESLIDRGMLERLRDDDGSYEYIAFRVTSKGMSWLSANKENLNLEIIKDELQISAEDIPF